MRIGKPNLPRFLITVWPPADGLSNQHRAAEPLTPRHRLSCSYSFSAGMSNAAQFRSKRLPAAEPNGKRHTSSLYAAFNNEAGITHPPSRSEQSCLSQRGRRDIAARDFASDKRLAVLDVSVVGSESRQIVLAVPATMIEKENFKGDSVELRRKRKFPPLRRRRDVLGKQARHPARRECRRKHEAKRRARAVRSQDAALGQGGDDAPRMAVCRAHRGRGVPFKRLEFCSAAYSRTILGISSRSVCIKCAVFISLGNYRSKTRA
jgi:hypothetical protein